MALRNPFMSGRTVAQAAVAACWLGLHLGQLQCWWGGRCGVGGGLVAATLFLVVVVASGSALHHLVRHCRHRVARGRRRWTHSRLNLDLDLCYVNHQLVAMSWPAHPGHLDALWRNPARQVDRLLRHHHPAGACHVWNLVAERSPHPAGLFAACASTWAPFPDHSPPPLALLHQLANQVATWLAADADRVAVVHCKAGKGRTGLVVAATLLRTGLEESAAAAAACFNRRRCQEEGGRALTVPSQLRYLGYFERDVRAGRAAPLEGGMLMLERVELVGGELVGAEVRVGGVPVGGGQPVRLQGEVEVEFFMGTRVAARCCLHTAYERPGALSLQRAHLDVLAKVKGGDPSTGVVLHLAAAAEE